MLIREVPGGAGAPLLSGMLTFNQIQKGHIPRPPAPPGPGPLQTGRMGLQSVRERPGQMQARGRGAVPCRGPRDHSREEA